MTTDQVKLTYEPGGKGNWDQDSIVFDFSWTLEKEVLTMKSENPERHIVFHIAKINDGLMSFVLTDRQGNDIIANACRLR